MKCPYCGEVNSSSVIDTSTDAAGNIRRRRECSNCGSRFSTYERPILATPQLVKSSGYREDFDRAKLLRSLQIACVKRPVSAEALENLVDGIENTLRELGQPEVPSKYVGDLVVEGLKNLDTIAYIRFTIVYLKLDNLSAIQAEVEKLMKEQN